MRVDAQRNRQLLPAAACDAFVAEEPTGLDALRRYLRDALDVGIAVMSRVHDEIDRLGQLERPEQLEQRTAGGR
jgi:hypothetical protein